MAGVGKKMVETVQNPKSKIQNPNLSENQFLLMVHSISQLGEIGLRRLLQKKASLNLSAKQCLDFSQEDWQEKFELKPSVANRIIESKEKLIAQSGELLRNIQEHSVEIITLDNVIYPEVLDRFDESPPPIFYGLGNLSLLRPKNITPTEDNPTPHFSFTIAISNDPAEESLKLQDEITESLVKMGGVPITGHDRIPYQRLALAAQRKNCSLFYVMDRGLREALGPNYDRPPFSVARIRDAVFDVKRDVVISPFRLDDHGLGANNRRRDRLIFALADVIIAVDVRAGGEMLKECKKMHTLKKPVFVMTGGREGNDTLRRAECLPISKWDNFAEKILEGIGL